MFFKGSTTTLAQKLNSTFLLWSDVLYAMCRVDKQGLSGCVRPSCANTDIQYFLSIQCQCLRCNDHPVKNYLIKLKLAIIWFTAGHLVMILCNNAEKIQPWGTLRWNQTCSVSVFHDLLIDIYIFSSFRIISEVYWVNETAIDNTVHPHIWIGYRKLEVLQQTQTLHNSSGR